MFASLEHVKPLQKRLILPSVSSVETLLYYYTLREALKEKDVIDAISGRKKVILFG